jgi:hypothetical protein
MIMTALATSWQAETACTRSVQVYVQTTVTAAGYTGQVRSGWDDVLRALQDLMRLRDDWDGEGAVAPSRSVVRSAIFIAIRLRNLESPIPTTAVATRAGTILFSWQDGSDYQEVEVTPDAIEWMSIDRNGVAEHGGSPNPF